MSLLLATPMLFVPNRSSEAAFVSGDANAYDTTNLASMWQEAAKTNPVTTAGQDVGAIDGVGNTSTIFPLSEATNPPSYLASGLLDFAADEGLDVDIFNGMGSDAARATTRIAVIIDNFTGTEGVIVGTSANSIFALAMDSSSGTTSVPGAVSIWVDGVPVADNRSSLRAALNDGNRHLLEAVFSSQNAAYVNSSLGWYTDSGPYRFAGELSPLYIGVDLSDANRDGLRAIWESRWGVSIASGPTHSGRSGSAGTVDAVNFDTTLTVSAPAGRSVGDTLYAYCAVDGNDALGHTGWTEIGSTNFTSSIGLRVLKKDAAADGTSSDDLVLTAGSNEAYSAVIDAWSDVTGEELSTAWVPGAATASVDPPSHTPATAGEAYVAIAAADADPTVTVPALYNNDASWGSSGTSSGATIIAGHRIVSAATEDPPIFTLSASEQCCAFTLAIW